MASGTFSSRDTLRSKTLLLYGLEVPNDPMTMDAWIGFDEVRNWIGRSLWAWSKVSFVLQQLNLCSYQIDLSFPTFLHFEHKRFFETSCRVGKGQERLVRSLRCCAVGGGEHQLQGVGRAQ